MERLEINIKQLQESAISALARSYNILDYPKNLINILNTTIPGVTFDSFSKPQLHGIINKILTQKYKGEAALKAKLVEKFKENKVTAAFEIKVNNSRVDFLKVNGDTVSYEIKSRIDNLSKLSKQVSDYEKVFEYNFIVIDETHYKAALKIIPDHYGIYVLEKNKLLQSKTAALNNQLDSNMQLRLFTKKELEQTFKNVIPDITLIKETYTDNQINNCFKEMLKRRYTKKWNFLKDNLAEILPVDYQFFFHHNIQPKVIYGA
ncbi:MAG: sce7726 family protein [Bacteroidetes bacterium]|nr:sce7726 family protein [Bacteroidota bacterium]